MVGGLPGFFWGVGALLGSGRGVVGNYYFVGLWSMFAGYCRVEQMVARRTHNPEVAGSSPAPATGWVDYVAGIITV